MKTKIRILQIALLLLNLPALMAASGNPAPDDDQPTIAKDWIELNAFPISSYHKSYATLSWVPRIKFRVNGPIPSGSQLYVEFSLPGSGPWVKFDCKTGEIGKGRWWNTDCGGRDIPEDKGSIFTGTVNFTIGLRNELASTNMTLFTGKAKVGKAHTNETGPNYVNHYAFYIDHDWALPIGYVFYLPDDTKGWKYPSFHFAIWERGPITGPMEPHLFHNGKEVGKTFYQGEEVGKASCGSQEMEINASEYTAEKGPKYTWTRWRCDFPSLHAYNKTGEKVSSMFGPLYQFDENPGDYEIKVLYQGHLSRSLKFAVDDKGVLVDNGIAKTNKVGTGRIIVPVQVLGDSDGAWDHAAWKTGAFYGNPLTGFSLTP